MPRLEANSWKSEPIPPDIGFRSETDARSDRYHLSSFRSCFPYSLARRLPDAKALGELWSLRCACKNPAGALRICINDILMDDQQPPKRHSATVDKSELRVRRRKLSVFAAPLADHPYRPRSVVPSNDAKRALPGLAAWENEGGRVARISPKAEYTAQSPTKNPGKSALPTS